MQARFVRTPSAREGRFEGDWLWWSDAVHRRSTMPPHLFVKDSILRKDGRLQAGWGATSEANHTQRRRRATFRKKPSLTNPLVTEVIKFLYSQYRGGLRCGGGFFVGIRWQTIGVINNCPTHAKNPPGRVNLAVLG